MMEIGFAGGPRTRMGARGYVKGQRDGGRESELSAHGHTAQQEFRQSWPDAGISPYNLTRHDVDSRS
jgi:hypothetical protein